MSMDITGFAISFTFTKEEKEMFLTATFRFNVCVEVEVIYFLQSHDKERHTYKGR